MLYYVVVANDISFDYRSLTRNNLQMLDAERKSWMETIIVSYIAGATSLVAIFISIYNSFIEKRRLITEVITKNRIEWIINVRNLLIQFLESYQTSNINDMMLIHNKLSLYMNNYNPQYSKLLNAMKVCYMENLHSQESIEEMIHVSQEVLSAVWTRMKREAGIKRESETDLLIKLHEEFNDGPIC
jgi:hypothetical protein